MSATPSEENHTPGPWKLVHNSRNEKYSIQVPAANPQRLGYLEIAEVMFGFEGPFESQQHANARLIAAAPDLLAALKAVITISDRKHDAWDAAKAAIAKAEGRS